MKLYVITSGDYSDYGIDSIFLNKEIAESYVESRNKLNDNREVYRIEEWENSDNEPFKKSNELKRYWVAAWSRYSGGEGMTDVNEIFVEDENDGRLLTYPNNTEEEMIQMVKRDMRYFGNKAEFEKYFQWFQASSNKSAEHAAKKLHDHIAQQKAIFHGITL